MPFDYANKGWPSPITLNGVEYTVTSCDQEDKGLVYEQAASKNPHLTIHGADKEGPSYWQRYNMGFHVRISGTKLYEFDWQGKPDEFVAVGKGKGTGGGTPEQTAEARAIAADFMTAMKP